jgi:hypothetical protein
MKVQAKGNPTSLYLDDSDAGEGLAIFLSQDPESLVRWNFEVFAKNDANETLLVGSFITSPPRATLTAAGFPAGKPTRQVAAAVCPGAKSWSVIVSPSVGPEVSDNEVCNVTLSSSKCCTAPVGLSRVSERYDYRSGATSAGDVLFSVAPGRTITSIGVIGIAPGGTVQIGTGADVITVPTGLTLSLEPKAAIPAQTAINFTNCLWTIEYLESA